MPIFSGWLELSPLNILGENVKNMRRTVKGELLLELGKPEHQNTGNLRKSMEGAIRLVEEARYISEEVLI